MKVLKHAHQLRSLAPQSVRERLYEWHPGRDRRWRRHPGLQSVRPTGCAVLTLDDGPDEDATPRVLDALDETGARATFFMLASQLERHADIAHDVVRRGHEVALHGYGHERHDRISDLESRDDVVNGFAAVRDATGISCRWYRPPYGKMSPASAAACEELGMTPVYWSAWGMDWEEVTARRISRTACAQLEDGGILLLHDSSRYARRPSAVPTADAIPLIAADAQARGLSLISMGEAVAT